MDTYRALNLLLLLVFAALLMLPLLGYGRPAVGWVAGVLVLRLALNAWRAWREPVYRRPAAFALDAALIVALLTLGRG